MASGVAATRLNVPEGTEQAQNQGDTGTTAGQEEHQNNGTTEGQQDQTTAQVNTVLTHHTIRDISNTQDAEFLASEQSKFDTLGSQM